MKTVLRSNIITPMKKAGPSKVGHNLFLRIYFPSTSHFVRKEYIIYTYDSLVADAGGYLGLLLGQRYKNYQAQL